MKDFSYYDSDYEFKSKIHDALEYASNIVHERAEGKNYKVFHVNKVGYITSLCFHIRNYLTDEWFYKNKIFMMVDETIQRKTPDIGFYVGTKDDGFFIPIVFVEVEYKNTSSHMFVASIEKDMKRLHNYKKWEEIDTYFIGYMNKLIYDDEIDHFKKLFKSIKCNYILHKF